MKIYSGFKEGKKPEIIESDTQPAHARWFVIFAGFCGYIVYGFYLGKH